MSIQIISTPTGVVVQLHTAHAKAHLIPALPLDLMSSPIKAYFDERLAVRQQQGYVEEDAATLAVFDCSIAQAKGMLKTFAPVLPEPQPHELLQFQLFPQLRDQSHLSTTNQSGNSLAHDADSAPADSTLNFARLVNPSPGIYPIVDSAAQLEPLMAAGSEIIQLRIKSESLTPAIEQDIRRAVSIASRYPRSQLFINDYWQSAIDCGAYGVHLGQEDLLCADLGAIARAGLRLGVSSHAFWEVARAATLCPSYIACGPVFPTRAKAMPWIPQGVDNLRYWSALLPFPVIGIGGINTENLKEIAATGCSSASVIAAITNSPQPDKALAILQAEWLRYQQSQTPKEQPPTRKAAVLARPTLR